MIDKGFKNLLELNKERLLYRAENLYNEGHSIRCSCRMTIRHFLADIDTRLELEEECTLIDELINEFLKRD